MPVPIPDEQRIADLRRMKVVATGLLVIAAAVFVVAELAFHGEGVWGYVAAAAEASMVGGLADWFAVVALFRHPLRIPVPHTAIIPKKKDQIGSGLAGFVRNHFLTPAVVQERLAAAHLPARIGTWLAEPRNAARAVEEVSKSLAGVAAVARDDEIRHAVAAAVERRLRDFDVAPLASRGLNALCDSGQHQQTLSSAIRAVQKFLSDNRAVFRRRLGEKMPVWVPEWVDDRVFDRAYEGVQRFLAEVLEDPDHEIRELFDRQLRKFALDIAVDPGKRERIESAKLQLLEHPDMKEWLSTLWESLKRNMLADAADPASELRRTAESMLVKFGVSMRDDPHVQARVQEFLGRVAGFLVENYGDEFGRLISSTIERWDTDETSRRLELQVGRDLQFIRLNGTVVGALAGLAIYTLSQLL